jgi:Arp2/3 complex, 34 kD subunit p34-Arc
LKKYACVFLALKEISLVHQSEELSRPCIRVISLSNCGIGAGNPNLTCEISYRVDEKYWVIASKNEVTIAFALNFDNATDKALARIFLLVL